VFVDAQGGDYHLSANSPCIDTGNPAGDYSGQTDIDGEARVKGTAVDIGADEADESDKAYKAEVPLDPLSEALDTSLGFTSGGDAGWFGQDTTFYYNGDAAESGDIDDDQESWIETTIDGSGVVEFYWKVSSESSFDYLDFYIDDVFRSGISGEVDWEYRSYEVTGSGPHTLRWRYIKDCSASNGSDCGWVDKVEWKPNPVGG
jgi:hypothetical protein